MKNNKLLLVLGMHRSGTSAVARGLQVLGVDLGDRLMQPIAGNNDSGFWEDIDVNAFNVELLGALGSDWNHLAPIETGDLDALRLTGYFTRAIELIRSKTSGASVFGLKDPRMPKLLPFWKSVFAHCSLDVGHVLAIRHPLSVVKSLARRDNFDAEKGYLLWLGHVLSSLSNSEDGKRLLLDYDRLMQDPDRELRRVADCHGLEIGPQELQAYKQEFLDEGLRHTRHDLNDLAQDAICPALVREVYATMLKLASDEGGIDDKALRKLVAGWNSEFERIQPSLGLRDRLFSQRAAAMQTIAERDGQIANLGQRMLEQDARIGCLNDELDGYRQQAAKFDQLVRQSQNQLRDALDQLSEERNQLRAEQSRCAALSEQLLAYQRQAEEFDRQLRDAQGRIDGLDSANQQLRDLEAQRARDLENSRFLARQMIQLLKKNLSSTAR
jgi:hypothetical protein